LVRLFIFTLIILPFQLQAKLTVVFDIDETLCFRCEDYDLDEAAFTKRYPEFKVFKNLQAIPRHCYFLIPYFDVLIKFLLNKDFEIHFFSAGSEGRNKELMAKILCEALGQKKYEQELKNGQFKVFSYHHMVPRFANDQIDDDENLLWYVQHRGEFKLHPPDLNIFNLQNITKKLRHLFPEKNIDDIILIDDRLDNATSHYFAQELYVPMVKGEAPQIINTIVHDKTEMPLLTAGSCNNLIPLLDSGAPHLIASLVMNSSIYYAGVISHCLNLIKCQKYTFRNALSVALNIAEGDHEFVNLYDPANRMLNPNLDFYLQLGLGNLKAISPAVERGILKPAAIEFSTDSETEEDTCD
jgi:hypothetical protein